MDERSRRAVAVACAAIVTSRSNEMPDMETFLGIADEFVQYIEGDDSIVLPRPDSVAAK